MFITFLTIESARVRGMYEKYDIIRSDSMLFRPQLEPLWKWGNGNLGNKLTFDVSSREIKVRLTFHARLITGYTNPIMINVRSTTETCPSFWGPRDLWRASEG